MHRTSRELFEQLVARADTLVAPEHVPMVQDAIYRLCEFQDANWAAQLVGHLEDLLRAERDAYPDVSTRHTVAPHAIRALVSLMVWPDAAWVANRKRRSERLKELRAAHGLTRHDGYDLVEFVPLDPVERSDVRHPHLRGSVSHTTPALLRSLRVERIRTTTISGAIRLRRLAAAARWRPGSVRQQYELDTLASWLEAMHDALRVDHQLAEIVARSGTLVQGSGVVREAHRATALAFWGRVVRQTIAIDRAAGHRTAGVAHRVIPFVWEQLCRSGPLALWEYAAQIVGIAMAHARGLEYTQTVVRAEALCAPRRPGEGA